MKKTLLSMVALLVAGHAAMAQNGLTEIPDPDGSQFMCTVLCAMARMRDSFLTSGNRRW